MKETRLTESERKKCSHHQDGLCRHPRRWRWKHWFGIRDYRVHFTCYIGHEAPYCHHMRWKCALEHFDEEHFPPDGERPSSPVEYWGTL